MTDARLILLLVTSHGNNGAQTWNIFAFLSLSQKSLIIGYMVKLFNQTFTTMQTIIDKFFNMPTHTFEQVTEFPDGYVVWNIGRQNFPHERCIPLAKPLAISGDMKYHIDPNTLKYIEAETEELALQVIEEAKRHEINRKRFYEIINPNNPKT